ncbi:MAG TPA: transglycosylase domain-containing protein [Actinomycetota bacterium]|nr:transglycosylase domain-containing protein [Actinomycetota bacterium]
MATTTNRNTGRHRRGAASPRKRSSGNGGKQEGFKAFLRRYWWAFVAVPLVAIAGVIATVFIAYAMIDIPDTPPAQQTTFVYDRHNKLITTFHAAVNRTDISLDDMPKSLRQAVIAVEDKDFYHHGGISLFGIFRAAWTNVTHGEIQQGGSTITQQYVKNVYTGSERTITRKVKEAILAVKLDHKYSKDEILTRYLNTVYFGSGAYGVEAAARTYFGRHARELTVLQSATLAGIIRSPGTYDPQDHPEASKTRRNLVLDLMVQQGYLDRAQADQLKTKPVVVHKASTKSSSKYPYFIDYVRRQMLSDFGEELTYSGGLRVRTTLDSTWEKAAEDAIAAHLPSSRDPDAALVAIDPASGAIRALVGGRDFDKVQFNAAFQAHRGAGSAFKPFTLTAAFEERISPNSIWNGPPSITIPDRQCYTNGQPWEVHNYADESAGTMNLIQATAHSVNTIFAQLVTKVGPDHVADVAHRMGIQSKLEQVCSITLGTQGVTPLEMTNAYATFAARGIRNAPIQWTKVTSPSGETLDKPKQDPEQAVDQNDADLATYAMQQVVLGGTGVGANIGRPVAGKTGTDQDSKNAWFCGFTPQLAACVWMGYEKSEKPMENVEGVSQVTGGSIPAAIWHDFMSVAMQDLPVEGFAKPSFAGYDKFPKGTVSPTPAPSPTPKPSPTSTGIIPLPSVTLPGSPSPSPSPSPTSSASAAPPNDGKGNGPPGGG